MSAIAMKGFLAGYMEKTAAGYKDPDTGMASPDVDPEFPQKRPIIPVGADMKTTGMVSPNVDPEYPTQRGITGLENMTTAKENYTALSNMLKSWMAPAAIGAGVVGAGSVGMDLLRKKKRVAAGKKPVNIKRALLLSVGLGIPLGVATKIMIQGGIPGFTEAAETVGRAGVSAGKQSWDWMKDVGSGGLAKAKSLGEKGKDLGQKMKERVVSGR